MATYIGYFQPNADFQRENGANAREAGSVQQNKLFRDKVVNLRDQLPSSLKLVGSYGPLGGGAPGRPSVWICETDNPDDLAFVSRWYTGFLDFEWVPAQAIGATSADTAKTMDRNS